MLIHRKETYVFAKHMPLEDQLLLWKIFIEPHIRYILPLAGSFLKGELYRVEMMWKRFL